MTFKQLTISILKGIGIGAAVIAIATPAAALTTLFPFGGGTGSRAVPSFGQVLVGTSAGVYAPTATSTLGLPTFNGSNIWTGTNTFGSLNGTIAVTGWPYAQTETGIQQAVNACSASNCSTVDLTNTVAAISNGITVSGNIRITSSASSTLTSYANFGANGGIFISQGSASNIEIDHINFNIGGNATAYSNRGGSNAIFDHNYVFGTSTAPGAVIYDATRGTSATSTNFQVLYNNFSNLPAVASTVYYLVQGHDIYNPVVNFNNFTNTHGPAVKADTQNIMHGLLEQGNYFTNLTTGGQYFNPAVALWGGITNPYTIVGTRFIGNHYFNSNKASGFNTGGVWLYQAQDTVISSNYFNCSWTPADGDNDDCPVIAPGRIGSPMIGLVIQGNTLDQVSSAWDPDSMEDVDVSGNTVTNSGECFDPGYNIQINVHIHNNNCFNTYNKDYNAAILFHTPSTVSNLVVENNSYYYTEALPAAFYDAYFTGGADYSYVIFRNNQFYHPSATSSAFLGRQGAEKYPLDNVGNEVTTPNSVNKNPGFSTGSIMFMGATTSGATTTSGIMSGDANLSWDAINERLGLASSTPGSLLSLGGIANFTSGTTTFYSTGGINLTSGCFSVNGTCLQTYLGLAGSTGQVTYFSGTNNAIGTSTLFITPASNIGIGDPNALEKLSVDGNLIVKGDAGGNSWSNQRILFGGDGTGYRLDLGSINNASTINSPAISILDNGRLGIGTTSPVAQLQAANRSSNATTTVELGKSGQNKGTCLKLYDVTGTAVYLWVQSGALQVSSTACASVTGF